jgi:hypothetical protein
MSEIISMSIEGPDQPRLEAEASVGVWMIALIKTLPQEQKDEVFRRVREYTEAH